MNNNTIQYPYLFILYPLRLHFMLLFLSFLAFLFLTVPVDSQTTTNETSQFDNLTATNETSSVEVVCAGVHDIYLIVNQSDIEASKTFLAKVVGSIGGNSIEKLLVNDDFYGCDRQRGKSDLK